VNPSAAAGSGRESLDSITHRLARLANRHYWLILGLLDLMYRHKIDLFDAARQHMIGPLHALGLVLAELGFGIPFDRLGMGYAPGRNLSATGRILLALLDEAAHLERQAVADLPADYPAYVLSQTRDVLQLEIPAEDA